MAMFIPQKDLAMGVSIGTVLRFHVPMDEAVEKSRDFNNPENDHSWIPEIVEIVEAGDTFKKPHHS